jgi:hypothetical protein
MDIVNKIVATAGENPRKVLNLLSQLTESSGILNMNQLVRFVINRTQDNLLLICFVYLFKGEQ